MSDPINLKEAKKVVKEVVGTAKELNKLETAVLVASTAGFISLALLLHIVFWVFASMASALLLFRLAVYYIGRKDEEVFDQLELFDHVVQSKVNVWNSELPSEEREMLSEHLDSFLPSKQKKQPPTPTRHKALPAKSSSAKRQLR